MEQNPNLVIVAEDSPPNQKIVAHLLQKLGFRVEVCADGAIAWDVMQKLEGRKDLVAVISDIMMPNMDGLELLKTIRASALYAQLPVVFITAISEKEYIVEARQYHVNGYIIKPITMDKLQKKMKELLPNHVFPRIAS
jgi:two-component system chemotaxis response regulator CheY